MTNKQECHKITFKNIEQKSKSISRLRYYWNCWAEKSPRTTFMWGQFEESTTKYIEIDCSSLNFYFFAFLLMMCSKKYFWITRR